MKGHPNSYLDPAYDRLEQAVTKKLGLPEGLLGAIRTKGEQSNADQVSSKGARGVYQVTPSTRNLVLKKYGIDAFLSAENMAEAAGLILKEGLDRNQGDPVEAVAEYHGGTDKKARGPVNRAYVARVTGQGAPASTAEARNTAAVAPQRIIDAYNSGTMSAADRAGVDRALRAGQLRLPEGAALTASQGSTAPQGGAVIPKRVIDNYNNHSSMTDGQRALIDRDVAAGVLRLPEGAKLARPAPRTAADYAGITGRAAGRAVGGLRDMVEPVINPLSNVQRALGMVSDAADVFDPGGAPNGVKPNSGAIPTAGAREGIDQKFDAVGVARPVTPAEQVYSAAVEGALQGPAGGAMGEGRSIATNLLRDVVSGGVSGAAAEGAGQAGAPPVVQMAAGLAAGIPTAVGVEAVASRIASKFGPKVAKVVETVPEDVAFDAKGAITPDGREYAARAGVEAEDLRAAYVEAANPEPATARAAEGGVDTIERPAAEGPPVATPEEAAALSKAGLGENGVVDPAAVRRAANAGPESLSDQIVGDITSGDAFDDIDPQGNVRVAMAPEEISALRKAGVEVSDTGVLPPKSQHILREERAFRNGSARRPGAAAPEAPLPAGAAARQAEAAAFGVDLTKGQATKDFETQAAEQDLSGANTPEGRQVRDKFAAQNDQIKAATARFQEAMGDTSLDSGARGQILKDGLRELQDQGKQGVTAAYKLVRDLAEELGDNAKGLTKVDTAGIRESVLDLLGDDTVPDSIRTGLTQVAAKYGIIGESPRHIPETGRTTVMVRDHENKPVRGPNFAGKVEPLDLANAERFRQRLNDLYDSAPGGKNPQERLKPVLDDAVAAAAERAAKEGFGDVGRAATEARDAYKGQKATFEAKDAINDLIAWKNGTQTDKVSPDRVWSVVFGQGPDALTNIKKLRAVLLSKPTEASKAAWEAIKAQSVAKLFKEAEVINGAGGEGSISGAKLNAAVAKFGPKKLKLILGDERFNEFMRLKRVIGDATIPLPKTTNPSGSGHLIARFLGNTAKAAVGGARLAGMGGVVDVVAGLAKQGAERAQAERVAEGATSFTPEQAAKADAAAKPATDNPASAPMSPDVAIRQFIDLASSNRLLAPLLASTSASQKEGDK